MKNNHMLLTAFLSQYIDTAVCVSHTEPVAMYRSGMSGIGERKMFRFRVMDHGGSAPISWGRLPDKIDR